MFCASPLPTLIFDVEEEWEKELEAELHDYEVVGENKQSKGFNLEEAIEDLLEENNQSSGYSWRRDIDDMLDDGQDLK